MNDLETIPRGKCITNNESQFNMISDIRGESFSASPVDPADKTGSAYKASKPKEQQKATNRPKKSDLKAVLAR